MKEVLKMNPKERERKGILEMVKQGHLTLKQDAAQSHLSYRHTRREYQAYLKLGDAGPATNSLIENTRIKNI